MSEPIFLRQSSGLTLEEIASLTGATQGSPAPHTRRIVNVAPLDRAAPSDLTFLDSRNFAKAATTTHAGACLTTAALAKELPTRVAVLIVREPYRAFVIASRALFPHALRPSSLSDAGDFSHARVDAGAVVRIDGVVDREDGARRERGGGAGARGGVRCSVPSFSPRR